MDLSNISALWFPVQCFSDAIMKGWYSATGIDINVKTNPFFSKVMYTEKDDASVQKALMLAADRPKGEVGVVVVAKDNHLQVISEAFTDAYGNEHVLPIIWNAKLISYLEDTEENSAYFRIYCDSKLHGVNGGAYAVYDPSSVIYWNDNDAAGFRWNKKPYTM
ncbi:hypothetical protein IJ096_03425 [Candidatus Saccharibacteria bacterium]|nr:hypothetical protein [Candidatus Saccharibacteria bacterium]